MVTLHRAASGYIASGIYIGSFNGNYILIFDSKHGFVRIPFFANSQLTYIIRYVHQSTFVYVLHNTIVTYLQIKVRRIVNYGTVPYSSVQYNTEPISIQFYGCTVLTCINICTYVHMYVIIQH